MSGSHLEDIVVTALLSGVKLVRIFHMTIFFGSSFYILWK